MDVKYLKQIEYCHKWLPTLERIISDKSLNDKCRRYNSYSPSKLEEEVVDELDYFSFLKEGYDSGIVPNDYLSFGEDKQEEIFNPSDDFINSLSTENIIRCIGWHFRCDHFDNGSLINQSLASGVLLKYFRALLSK